MAFEETPRVRSNGGISATAGLTIAAKADSAHRTVEPRNSSCRRYFFPHETDNFLPQGITGARPHFQPAEVFHARLQRAQLQILRAGFNQYVDSFFQKIKECEFISRARLFGDLE